MARRKLEDREAVARLVSRLGEKRAWRAIAKMGYADNAVDTDASELRVRRGAKLSTELATLAGELEQLAHQLMPASGVFERGCAAVQFDRADLERAERLRGRVELLRALAFRVAEEFSVWATRIPPLMGHAPIPERDAARLHLNALGELLDSWPDVRERIATAVDIELATGYRPKEPRERRKERLKSGLKRKRSKKSLTRTLKDRAPAEAKQAHADLLAELEVWSLLRNLTQVERNSLAARLSALDSKAKGGR